MYYDIFYKFIWNNKSVLNIYSVEVGVYPPLNVFRLFETSIESMN